jgi:hypothetical protein
MSSVYRRARGSTIWHFRPDCSQWPWTAFEQVTRTPADGSCCIECTYWPAWAGIHTAERGRRNRE